MKKALLVFFTLICFFCKAQQKDIDSIMGLLAKHPKKDTAMLGLLIRLSSDYSEVDIDKGIKIADSALRIINNTKAPDFYLASCYLSKGQNIVAKQEYDNAISLFKKALNVFIKLNDLKNAGLVYKNIGGAFAHAGKFDSALINQANGRDLFKQTGDKKSEMDTYMNMGFIYRYLNNYPKALEYLNVARLYYSSHNNNQALAIVYEGLGVVNVDLKHFGEALDYYNKSLALFQQFGTLTGVSIMLLNIGSTYAEKKDFKNAIAYFIKALAETKQTGDVMSQGNCLVNIGHCFSDLKIYDSAFYYLKNGMPLVKGGEAIANANIALSEIILKASDKCLSKNGISPTNRYEKALFYAKKGEDIGIAQKATHYQFEALQSMSEIYEAQGNYKAALDAYKKFTILKDTVFNTEKAQAITRNEMQYDYDKEKLVAAAENERKQQIIRRKELLTRVIIIASFIVLLTGIVFYLLYKRKKKEAILTAEKMLAEEKMRRAQMNPHFIFNSMNLISNYIKNEPDIRLQRNYIVRFAKLMRLVLEASVKDETSLTSDLKLLETYLQLEMKRKDEAFDYSINIDSNVDADKVQVPPMLLLPLAENSIWHGFDNLQRMGKVEIHVSKDGDLLQMVLNDNGVGRQKAAEKPTNAAEMGHEKSYGLNITKTRIERANFSLKKKGSMQIFDLTQGMSVAIKIPFKSNT